LADSKRSQFNATLAGKRIELPDWLNMKNSDAPAVKREEQEDYGQEPDHELWAEK
jgi:hypothetical protein